MYPYPLFERNTRTPSPLPPPKSCDCAVHIFGDPAKYPPAQSRAYDPLPATVEDLCEMHRALGIERGVIVQATIYGTDHRLLVDGLKGRENFRGVAIVDDSVSDKELIRLHEAGVRGARFNLAGFFGIAPTKAVFERSIARIEELGWHAKIHGGGDELVEHADWLRPLRLPAVIDHLAGPDFRRELDQPGCRLALELLKRDNWWIVLSNGDRRSAGGHPWDDMIPFAQAYVAAAPDRTLWATDWPHATYQKKSVPNDADLLELLYRYVPDSALRSKVLVDNPARLYGFDG